MAKPEDTNKPPERPTREQVRQEGTSRISNPLEEVITKLKATEQRVDELEKELEELLKRVGTPDGRGLLDRIEELKADVAAMNDLLEEYQSLFGSTADRLSSDEVKQLLAYDLSSRPITPPPTGTSPS